MQHFPTYRKSDAVCREHDAPSIEFFRENWEVLSRKSTDLIGESQFLQFVYTYATINISTAQLNICIFQANS